MPILHGGQLSRVALQYKIPESQWLDLSTGIAPYSYPLSDIPLQVWQDLPTISDHFLSVAGEYYHADYCWPLSGSQSLIEKLPSLWREKNANKGALVENVYLPKVGYKEHQRAWELAGYQLHFYQQYLPEKLSENAVVVVINPNNPLTDTFTIAQLQELKKRCEKSNALLIIDEAFADVFNTEFSFTTHIKSDTEDVIVLRSFGKFFGLAGLRIGFACSGEAWFNQIRESCGPWAVNGPALYIAKRALQDKDWQALQIKRLQSQSKQQQELLETYLPVERIVANALFITVFLNDAPGIYQVLCEKAIYVRLTDENDALRFGIADDLQLVKLHILLQNTSYFDN